MRMVEVTVRAAVVEDEPFLWRMLLEAAHAGDEVDGPDALKTMPELARYVEGWGRPGDIGVIATRQGDPVGAAWLRLLVGDDAAYGYVDDSTPELAIAVDPALTGQGIGGALLTRLLRDAEPRFAAVSLSVRGDNDARRLYVRFGFRPVDGSEVGNRVGGTSITMVRRLAAG
jgi:ribosomal protein S18 acetylase RimI-like enzyme